MGTSTEKIQEKISGEDGQSSSCCTDSSYLINQTVKYQVSESSARISCCSAYSRHPAEHGVLEVTDSQVSS